MALIGNYSVYLKNPATYIGGTAVSNTRNAFGASGQNLQMYYPESTTQAPIQQIGLRDNFNDNSLNTSLWSTDSTSRVLEQNGNIEITTNLGVSYVGLYSVARYNLIGKSVSVKVEDAGNQSLASLEVYVLYVESDSQNAHAIMISGNTVYARRKTGGSWSNLGNVAYSTQVYFRIREFLGTIYYEYSVTGEHGTYTAITSTATTFQVSSNLIGFFVGTYSAEASTTTVIYDDFNVSPLGNPFTWSLPTGTEPPFSYHLADVGGELSSTTQINGTSDFTASMQNGINIVASLEGSGTMTSGLSLVTSMIATISCTGTLTGSMVGTIQMAADLAGSGDITGSLGMLSGLVANLSGQGLISADLKGKLFMAADVYVNQSEATVQQIVDAVLNALAADYNLPGTIGEAINGAGSAGNPWITDLSGYNTANTAGKILKDRLSKSQFLGLK